MADATVRDVVIRVSIENGNLKLGPVDTSALESQIKEAVAKAIGSPVVRIKVDDSFGQQNEEDEYE